MDAQHESYIHSTVCNAPNNWCKADWWGQLLVSRRYQTHLKTKSKSKNKNKKTQIMKVPSYQCGNYIAHWRPSYDRLICIKGIPTPEKTYIILKWGPVYKRMDIRADSGLAPRQWETSLQCNAVSHWRKPRISPGYHDLVASYIGWYNFYRMNKTKWWPPTSGCIRWAESTSK